MKLSHLLAFLTYDTILLLPQYIWCIKLRSISSKIVNKCTEPTERARARERERESHYSHKISHWLWPRHLWLHNDTESRDNTSELDVLIINIKLNMILLQQHSLNPRISTIGHITKSEWASEWVRECSTVTQHLRPPNSTSAPQHLQTTYLHPPNQDSSTEPS